MKKSTVPKREFKAAKRVKIMKKIEELRAKGVPAFAACKRAGVDQSLYYRWRLDDQKTAAAAKPGNSKPAKRKAPAKRLNIQDIAGPEAPKTEDDAIPVMLVKLTPAQLAAFFQG